MKTFTIRQLSTAVRCHWYYDEHYETVGSYAYDTPEETEKAEQDELAMLQSGDYVALGCVVEELVKHCPHCGRAESWENRDSLWGIVIEGTDSALDKFAMDSLDIPSF